jgi:hypothetical protein
MQRSAKWLRLPLLQSGCAGSNPARCTIEMVKVMSYFEIGSKNTQLNIPF